MKKMKFSKKAAALAVAGVMLVGGVGGGTLAWLKAETGQVENVFSASDIDVKLEETDRTYTMVPGWTMDKDPIAYVSTDSEDCYLFVEVIEKDISSTYKLGDYIDYKISDDWTELKNAANTTSKVYYKIIDEASKKGDKVGETEKSQHHLLADGSKQYSGIIYTWEDDQVLTKPTVTKEMMNAIDDTKGKNLILTFQAYAVQLWKKNKPTDGATESEKEAAMFTVEEAWSLAKTTSGTLGN